MRKATLVLLCLGALGAVGACQTSAMAIQSRAKEWSPPRVASHEIQRSPCSVSVGTYVRLPASGISQFVGRRVGYALVTVGNGTYPAKSVDGGRRWHVAGPMLHQNAAQGGAGVGVINVEGPDVALAWGGITPDGVIDWTTDGGAKWFTVRLPGLVLYVGGEGGTLVANIYGSVRQGTTTHSGLWAYRANAGGSWSYLGKIS